MHHKGGNIYVEKSETAVTWPPVLVLHVNRFQRVDHQTQKITRPIDTPTTSRLPNGTTYNLRATIRHHGHTPTTGHYVAAVATPPQQSWLLCTDAKLPAVLPTPDVETRHAYLLFYAQGGE